MNRLERLTCICVFTLQAATSACFLTRHLHKDEDISYVARISTIILSILSSLLVAVFSVIKCFYQQDHYNRKKIALYSFCFAISLLSSLLNICTIKQAEQLSKIAVSCISIMQGASFLSYLALFQLKRFFSISYQEEEVARLHLTPEPQTPIEILTSEMQLEQDRLNRLKYKLQKLENDYRNTNSPEILTNINNIIADIQTSISKIADFRRSIQAIEEQHRLPPPPYSQWLNPTEARLDSNASITNTTTETTIEREQEICKLERLIRHLQFKIDVTALKLNTDGLLTDEREALFSELEKLNSLMKRAKRRLQFLLEPSTLPSYSPPRMVETTV